ncbi:nudix hydrolase 15, mitochondrial [Aspergillus brasiliensis]|nr:nudix hydrolase 15, mitochondrial [Aspergillus brasiliensis]
MLSSLPFRPEPSQQKMATHTHARVGVAVFIFNGHNEFIIGQRKGSHGAGTWALPGGHLELNESFETCAVREILEETDLKVQDVRFLTVTNDIMKAEGKHYITVVMGCKLCDVDAQPKLMEPNKCSGWEWTTWEQLRMHYDAGKGQPWFTRPPRKLAPAAAYKESVFSVKGDIVPESDSMEVDEKTEITVPPTRQLFLPLMNLFEQRGGFDPVSSYWIAD